MTPDNRREGPLDSPVAFVQVALFFVLLVGAGIVLNQVEGRPARVQTIQLLIGLALLVPHATSFLMLRTPRLYHPGLALAASVSIIVLVPLGALTALSTLFLGFAAGNDRMMTAYVLNVALCVVLAAVSVASIRTVRRVPESHKKSWSWAAGPVCILYGMSVYGAAQAVIAFEQRRERALATRIAVAQERVVKIAECARAYAAEHPRSGMPATLEPLLRGERPCLDPAVGGGEAAGFRYEYLPGVPDEQGVIHLFDACATPVTDGKSGTRAFAIDQSGVKAEGYRPGRDPAAQISCREAWGEAYDRAIQFCAVRFAAAHPDRGYPASLREIGPEGDGCLSSGGFARELKEHSLVSRPARYTYVAAPPDAGGRVRHFQIYVRTGSGESAENELLTARGALHVSRGTRLPTPDDPLSTSLVEQRAKWGYRIEDVGRACTNGDAAACVAAAELRDTAPAAAMGLLEQACASGLGAGCRKLGHLRQSNPPAAGPPQAAFGRGCDLQDGESCFELARLATAAEEARPLFERACELHAGRGCVAVARALDHQAAGVEPLLQRGCDAGEPSACTRLGQRLLGVDPARARRLMIKGCAGVDGPDQVCNAWR